MAILQTPIGDKYVVVPNNGYMKQSLLIDSI